MLIKRYFTKHYLKLKKASFSSFSETDIQKIHNKKKGNIYVKSTNNNIFCTLIDIQTNKVETSCSLRVPRYQNEFNEREDLFTRGVLLGELFGNKIIERGFTEVAIYLDYGINKGRRGFLKGLETKRIKISFIQLLRSYPHNGCRPSKIRRKKVRTKLKN